MLVLGELESTFLSSLRGSEATEAIHTQKVDSSMDRHADKSARDDRKGGVSRDDRKRATQENAFSKPSTQAAGFLMRNCSFQGAGAGIYLGDNEQARAVESTIYRKKPTPKPNQNQSNKPNKKEFYNETTSQKHLLPSQSPSSTKRPKV